MVVVMKNTLVLNYNDITYWYMRPTYIVSHDLSSTKRKKNHLAFIYLFFISFQINQQTKISLQWLFKNVIHRTTTEPETQSSRSNIV